MNNYNGETDFLNWYKKNYGVDYDNNVGLSKKEGMSDIDYRIGTNLKGFYDLNNSYQKNKETDLANRNKYYDEQVGLLQNQYGMAVDSLDSNKRIAQQNASIGLDKLKKYLPTQIKSQGLGGLGVSESSMLQAYNKYNNDMGDIAGNYNSNKANLESNKLNQISSLENYRQDNLNDINQKYSDYEQSLMGEAKSSTDLLYEKYLSEQENGKKEQQALMYNEFMSRIERGSGYGYNTVNELKQYFNEIKNSLSETQQKIIEGSISQLENSIKSQESDREYYKNTFNKDGVALSQDEAESKMQYIKNDNSISLVDKEVYQKVFDSMFPNSYYASTNGSKAESKDKFNLYSELAESGMSKNDLDKVNVNTLQTSSPFKRYQIYWKGRDGWYAYNHNGTEYWYKKK